MTAPPSERDWSATDAESDSEHFAEYLEKATAFDQIREYKSRSHDLLGLEEGSTVIDAGCGMGDDVMALAELVGPSGEAVGIDNSEELIDRARGQASEIPNARFEVADIYDLDFDTGLFNASRADRVLQHLERPDQAVAELIRVTQSGGRIGLTDPDWESLVIDVPGAEPAREILDFTYAVSRNPGMGRRLYGLARDAGLVDVSVDAFVLHSTDFEFVSEMTEIESWTAAMEDAGVIQEDVRDRWVGRLRDGAEAGRFFAAMPAYTVTGTVPG